MKTINNSCGTTNKIPTPERDKKLRYKTTFIPLLALALAGCPGGWRERVISTNAPYKIPEGMVATYHGYGVGKVIAPGYLINEDLYVSMFSGNLHDLAFEDPPDGMYRLGGLLSAAKNGLHLDTRSFTLYRGDDILAPARRMVSTNARVTVTPYGEPAREGCSFRLGEYEVAEESIEIPRYNETEDWPPLNKDLSVFCFELQFDLTIRDVPPEKPFQLRFTYVDGEIQKDARLYFYPLKYTIFEH